MKNDEFPSKLLIVAAFVLISFLVIKAQFISSVTYGPNYENVSVDTRVNISQSQPQIINVTLNTSITLAAGRQQLVMCEVTVRDYNGWNDVTAVNATFFDANNATSGSADDNNDHYTNASCVNVSNDGQYESVWNCSFNVWYYANNGTNWRCNATAIDAYYPTDSNYSDSWYNTTEINALYALNVTSLIDYGDMAVGDTSSASETANITHFGNLPINISLYGWGGNNLSVRKNSGLAFVCEQGNITVGNERFSQTDQAWTLMTNLTNESALIFNYTMLQRTNDAQPVINVTYWRLYIPPNPFGLCNGTVVFAAEIP